MPTTSPHFATLRSWLNEITGEKEKAASDGKPITEVGTYVGETKHVSKSVPDFMEVAKEGPRAAENASDVKKMVPSSVDAAKPDSGEGNNSAGNKIPEIGTRKSSVGEDPASENDFKTDTGVTAESSKVEEALSGREGYKASAELAKAAKAAANLANEILADISVSVGAGRSAAPSQDKQAAAAIAQAVSASSENAAAAQAGYELAAYLGFNKQSADQTAQAVVADTITKAAHWADRVGQTVLAHLEHAEKVAAAKRAVDGAAAGLPPEPDGDEGAAAAGGSPAPGGAEAALGGLGGAGADAGAGAPPAGGGGDPQAALAELAMALEELGISPEQLVAAMQGAGGGAGAAGGLPAGGGLPPGGPPPEMAGGLPPEMAGGPPPGSPADMGAKIASAVRDYKRSGKFRFSEAKTAEQRHYRDQMKSYIRELIGTGR